MTEALNTDIGRDGYEVIECSGCNTKQLLLLPSYTEKQRCGGCGELMQFDLLHVWQWAAART